MMQIFEEIYFLTCSLLAEARCAHQVKTTHRKKGGGCFLLLPKRYVAEFRREKVIKQGEIHTQSHTSRCPTSVNAVPVSNYCVVCL